MTESNQTDVTAIARRTALKGLGAGGLAALGGCVSAAHSIGGNSEASVDQWPQLQYDGAHSGHAPTGGPRNDVAIKWQYKTENIFQSGPVVAGGMVYASNWDLKTYALDAETGELQWTFPKGHSDKSPAVFNGTVYFSAYGGLYAVDAKTGELRWKNQGRGGGQSSGVTVANGTLYYSGAGGLTLAVDPETGEELWTSSLGSRHQVAVKDGRVFGARWKGKKFALDAKTGEELWTQEYSHAFTAPAVGDGTVYWGSGQSYFGYDASTGEKTFEGRHLYTDKDGDDNNHVAYISPAVVDGVLYGGSSESIFAVDTETGEALWKHTDGEVGFGGLAASPAVVDGILYIGDLNGRMWGFDAETGEPRFATRIANALLMAPAVINGNIYITSECCDENEKSIFALEDPTT